MIRLAFALLLSFSTVVAAQGRGPRRVSSQPRRQAVELKRGDLERLDPAKVILDQRKPLALAAAQEVSLDSLRRAFDEKAAHLVEVIKRSQHDVLALAPDLKRPPEDKPVTRKDSLSRAKLDSTNQAKRDAYIEQVTVGRRDLTAALLELRTLYDATSTSVLAVLTDDQRAKTASMLQQADDDFSERLRAANIR